MQSLQGRPSLRRGATDMLSPSFQADHAAGEYTPQVSPLDDLINRGRMLQRQMGSERAGSAGLNPMTVHRSLRRAGSNPGTLGTLARSRSVGRTPEVEKGGQWGNASVTATSTATAPILQVMGDRQLATPALEDRPASSYPRFSTVSEATSDDGRSDRDSVMSGATSVRDSNFTLISGFLDPVRDPPNLQQIQGRHEVREQDVERSSLKPVIVGHIKDERQRRETEGVGHGPGDVGARGGPRVDNQPRGAIAQRPAPDDRQRGPLGPLGIAGLSGPEGNQRSPGERQRGPPGPPGPAGRQKGPDGRQHSPGQRQQRGPPGPDGGRRGPDERQWGKGQDQRDMAGQDNRSAYSRSRSQPPLRNRRPPGKQPLEAEHQFPTRKDSRDLTVVIPPGPPAQPAQHGQPVQTYIPYRQDSKSSPLGYSAPSRQGSAESGKFPPPVRQASGERLHPHRNDSRGSDRRFYPRSPRREGSNDSVTRYLPYRQGSGDVEFQRPSRTDSLESVHRPYSPQLAPGPRTASPAQAPPSIFPMISDFRASSPDSIGAESSLTFGPPSAPLTRNPSVPYSGTDNHDMTRSVSQSSLRSDAPSVYSAGGTLLQKPTFNFSRPLSSRPSFDSEQPPSSLDIPQRLSPEQSPMLSNEQSLPTPASTPGVFAGEAEGPVPTYIYSKFTLPRGREPERDSVVFQGSSGFPGQTVYQQTPSPSTPLGSSTTTVNRPPSPSSPPRTFLQPAPPPRDPGRAPQTGHPSSLSSRTGLLTPTMETRGRSATVTSPCSPRTPNSRSNSSQPPSATMSPDDHVQLGIDLHESGSLQESTYHLRFAANAGHPTGMLMFALACRHGWGMKANQKEGVTWLKKVTELASSEVADDEQAGGSVDYIEKKGRRAQFALSIYELGVSHMNGWGTEKDQGLALRCFEIAGRWGDPDALSEAGYCYANGVGCKKDLKKSAKFYRMAEAKGVNMVGNSWIWKDKYLDEEEKAAKKGSGGGKKK
ncbi:unnamed protein product [Tuber aestivum]|uniref:Uncharacterized protein n=1 Tax=Tuber aestivum TaxID=59557 RepID=A0A292PRD3_9PEZI|nr:unnamed protein product [Tuber aestivum]